VKTADGFEPVITDLAVSPTGSLYGISFDALYLLDRQSGAAIEVGPLGLNDANAPAFRGDGVLYGATRQGNSSP
jgi:hypothetical protein